jgi:hypothetical protein
MAAWISEIFRLTSASGNVGVRTTSDTRSSPSAISFFCAVIETVSVSRLAPASTRAPTNSMAESSSDPVRFAVPRVSTVPVRLASPARSSGS